MRDNDLQLLFDRNPHERATRMALFRINEEVQDLKRTFKEMADTIEKMATVITMLNSVANGMAAKIDSFKKLDDDPRSTRELISVKSDDPNAD